MTDLFPRTADSENRKLLAAVKATGNDIKDVKAVVIRHLHLDHAGRPGHFLDPDVPIVVHEEKFKHVCWDVAADTDLGACLSIT
ncbi:uncharacterized protein Z519_01597 [Cladophialophora bantiana CBS 173.52]|uniref:Metallo-beta-lactamase domain-containing protein n=1 Tax=Cladophialophora bantiana (strain ATCC 10958 / CBS 173.52 / CDC B-1940 / NIH 8579) TaxID=1442370 RepID=A0A0D2HXC0_CLAB1|nr:uncharacterized protein Z519_01597 [Cladophialophora bantiana CBS 173.52]KIW98013.1 hypothetical protein Z519_01597 [Cladophialophora bantiana CBS 173.52]